MGLFSNLSKTAKIMIVSIIAVCFILLAAGLIVINLLKQLDLFAVIPENLPYALGLVLGGTGSMVKVVLIENGLRRIMDLGEDEKDRAKLMGTAYYIGRSFFTVTVLALGILVPLFSIAGTVAGVLSLRVAAPLTHVIEMQLEKKQENTRK